MNFDEAVVRVLRGVNVSTEPCEEDGETVGGTVTFKLDRQWIKRCLRDVWDDGHKTRMDGDPPKTAP